MKNNMKKWISMAAALLAVGNLAAQDNVPEGFKVGSYEVYVLTENSGTGNTGILIDAPQAVLEEYAPDGTFPNAVNAVLIKGPGKTWLIDTGFGRNIFDRMAALGVTPEEVDVVLLTHMHGDHIGGMFRNDEKTFPHAEVVVSQKEYDYWSSEAEMNKLPENRRGSFLAAQKVFSGYGGSLTKVEPSAIGDKLPEGITAVSAYGHTPGHVGFMVSDNGNRLLVWGDLAHAMAVQMPHPEISVTYDVDPDVARESRLEILRYIAVQTDSGDAIRVVGMHVPAVYPGVIHVEGNGYRFQVLQR